MPTYEYVCKKCGNNLEVFQSFADKPLKTHKECGGQLQKVFHARGIVFKGSGFYATDSKPSSNGGGEAKDKPKPDKSPEKRPEKKPAKTSTPTSKSD